MSKGKEPALHALQAIFKGGYRAAKTYDRATGGSRLSDACEYILTAGVLDGLSALRGATLVEVPVKWASKEAGVVRRGRPSKKDRLSGRFDLVYYRLDGKPRAAIEVKSPIRNSSKASFRGDFFRLTRTLRAKNRGSYQFCAFVFFATINYNAKKYSFPHQAKTDAKERLKDLMDKIEALALGPEYLGEELIRRLYRSRVNYSADADEGAWQFGVLIFAPKKSGAATFTKKLIEQA